MQGNTAYLLVNFGGPRALTEIKPFLQSLLTDKEVVRTKLPAILHRFLFKRIAARRAQVVGKEYVSIGGRSPLYADTEAVAQLLEERLQAPVLTFHRYLPRTHSATLEALETIDSVAVHVFPMFPQFSYATTGSCAQFFKKNLPHQVLKKMYWVKSYSTHPAFIHIFQEKIRNFLQGHHLEEKRCIFIFSAHGLPLSFVEEGDPYARECEASFHKIMQGFPQSLACLAYQSKFGPGEWLKPSTETMSRSIGSWNKGRDIVVFIPLSFTSDHLETLSEVEKQYMPLIREKGLKCYRLPAFNRSPQWVEAIETILAEFPFLTTTMLLRKK